MRWQNLANLCWQIVLSVLLVSGTHAGIWCTVALTCYMDESRDVCKLRQVDLLNTFGTLPILYLAYRCEPYAYLF